MTGLTEAIDGLRQSFAGARAPETASDSRNNKSVRTRHARRGHARTRG